MEQIPEIRLYTGSEICQDKKTGNYAFLVNHRVKLTFPVRDKREPVVLSERRFVMTAEDYIKTLVDRPAKILAVYAKLAEIKTEFPEAKSDTAKFEHLDNSKAPFWIHRHNKGDHLVVCSVCRWSSKCKCPEGKGAPESIHPHLKRQELCKRAVCFLGDYE